MSEVVEEHPSLIPVINRFGIRLGLGDKSVKAICEEHRLDADFLLAVVNTYLNEEYFPEKKLQTFHTSQIVDYLTKTNLYYQRYQIPNIERHLASFIAMSRPGNNTLNLIGKFFSSFKEELTARIEKDDRVWFPYCLSLSEKLKDHPASERAGALHLGTEQRMEDPIEALLADLKSIMVKHLSGDYNENLCYAVLFAVSSLKMMTLTKDNSRTTSQKEPRTLNLNLTIKKRLKRLNFLMKISLITFMSLIMTMRMNSRVVTKNMKKSIALTV